MGTKRTIPTGRQDTLGRDVKVSDQASGNDAPTAPPSSKSRPDGRVQDGRNRIPAKVGDRLRYRQPMVNHPPQTVIDARPEQQIRGHDGTKTVTAPSGSTEFLLRDDDTGHEHWTVLDGRGWTNESLEDSPSE